MLLLIPFALVLVFVSLLGLAGLGPLTTERAQGRSGLLGGLGPVVGLLVGVGVIVLNVLVFAVLVGMSRGGDGDDAGSTRPAPTTPAAPSRPASDALLPTSRAATATLAVTIDPDDTETFPTSYAAADQLEPETVLSVHAGGFAPFARAVAEQCVSLVAPACGNRIPVQFAEDGTARFQYLVTNDFLVPSVPGRCRADGARCSLVVRAGNNGKRGEVQTVFVDAVPPPGRITVTPAGDLALDGQTVMVAVERFPPGVTARAVLCAAPAATGPRCGAPGPAAALRVGADGTGRTRLRIAPGPVGTSGARCERGDDCGVSVVAPGVSTRAPVVPITFAAPPGAAYDPGRLVLGLGVALLLLAVALGLIMRSDWAAVGEAAAPEIDDAEYADLDAIIAALPPEEDDELVPS